MALVACQRDSYAKSFHTKVVECKRRETKKKEEEGYLVRLEDTVLFPEGGGQPTDQGTIGGVRVRQVYREESSGQVFHLAEREIPIGESVEVVVDWKRRWDHMQQHSAQHLISALASQHFQALTTSWSLGVDHCTIDFNVKEFSPVQLQQLEDLTNGEIRAGRRVEVKEYKGSEVPEEVRSRGVPTNVETLRLIEIQGIDLNTCCGTHVRSTSELQMVKFLGTEKTRGCVRLLFLAGERVSAAASTWIKREKELNNVFRTAPHEHVEAATRFKNEVQTLTREKKNLLKELANYVGENLAKGADKFCEIHREDEPMEFLQSVAQAALAVKPSLVLFLTNGSEKGDGQFLLIGPVDFVAKAGKQVAETLGGKGGGKQGSFQGKGPLKERAKAVELLKQLVQ